MKRHHMKADKASMRVRRTRLGSSYLATRAAIEEASKRNLLAIMFSFTIPVFGSNPVKVFGGKNMAEANQGVTVWPSPRAMVAQLLINMNNDKPSPTLWDMPRSTTILPQVKKVTWTTRGNSLTSSSSNGRNLLISAEIGS
jgi:hypothetical protein